MKKEEAIFIINSPFQAICALEAVSYFHINKPVFFVLNDPDSKRRVLQLVENRGEILYFDHDNKGTVSLIKRTIGYKIKSKTIFIGDYFSYSQFAIGVLCASLEAKIYYLDDGGSTLTIFPPVSRKRYSTNKNKIVFRLFLAFASIKRVSYYFYSIFNLPNLNNRKCLIKNNFTGLKNKMLEATHNGIYIIGTNSSVLKIQGGYDNLLKKSIEYLNKTYPNEPVFYCPHRRDKNNYSELLSLYDVRVFNTEISVEVDFYNKNIIPVAVVGYGSTALLTLKMMYPTVDSISFSFKSGADAQRLYSFIENYYKSCGIVIV